MNKLGLSVVFMGNGPVAAKSLELMNEWANIELVITKKKPQHHKDPAPVEEYCLLRNLPVVYANNKNELEEVVLAKQPSSAIGIVVDYGVIINQNTIDYFEKGIVNSHFSLLPEWRGADPITYSLLSGQDITGVSLMLIDKGLDTGALIATKTLKLSGENNYILTEKLIAISNELFKDNLPSYLKGGIATKPQDTVNNIATYSRMLYKNDGIISPDKPASVIAREIKAYINWPKSKLLLESEQLIITEATVSNDFVPQGQLAVRENKILLGCKNSSLQILRLKPAGKKEMTATAFLNGYGHLIN